MSILDTAVAIANSVTYSLGFQATITFERCIGTNRTGDPTYATAVPLDVILEIKQRMVKNREGVLVGVSATIMFLDINALTAATPANAIAAAGVSPSFDRITLPNGLRGLVVNVGGFVESGGVLPVATEAYL